MAYGNKIKKVRQLMSINMAFILIWPLIDFCADFCLLFRPFCAKKPPGPPQVIGLICSDSRSFLLLLPLSIHFHIACHWINGANFHENCRSIFRLHLPIEDPRRVGGMWLISELYEPAKLFNEPRNTHLIGQYRRPLPPDGCPVPCAICPMVIEEILSIKLRSTSFFWSGLMCLWLCKLS